MPAAPVLRSTAGDHSASPTVGLTTVAIWFSSARARDARAHAVIAGDALGARGHEQQLGAGFGHGAHQQRELAVVADGDADASERGVEHARPACRPRCPSRVSNGVMISFSCTPMLPFGVTSWAALT